MTWPASWWCWWCWWGLWSGGLQPRKTPWQMAALGDALARPSMIQGVPGARRGCINGTGDERRCRASWSLVAGIFLLFFLIRPWQFEEEKLARQSMSGPGQLGSIWSAGWLLFTSGSGWCRCKKLQWAVKPAERERSRQPPPGSSTVDGSGCCNPGGIHPWGLWTMSSRDRTGTAAPNT